MKLKTIIAGILVIVLLFGCVIEIEDEPVEEVEEEPVVEELKPPVEEIPEVPKTAEELCQEKATELIPKTFSLSIASSHNPNSSGWDLRNDSKWTDEKLIDTKGDIEFWKGRLENENTNYWYTRNIQNEKLFGVGGLKYSEKVTTEEGIVGKNGFIIKPILNPIKISDPKEPFDPYTGTFEIVDPGFVECSWVG